MRTVKLTIAFDGTRYEGWQSQKKENTLQEIFEKVLARILGEKTAVISSSRTDSGVHALGLVAHFRTKSALPDPKIKDALNFYLPRDILVRSAQTARPGFHARYHAKSKVYRYSIWMSRTRPLFEAAHVLWLPHRLDLRRMRKAAAHFIGRRDFSAFRDSGDEKVSYVRTVKRLAIRRKKELVQIDIEADGFLRHMVRIVVGTLMEAGKGKLKPEAIPSILKSKDRKKAGPTAKAMGLMLLRVKY